MEKWTHDFVMNVVDFFGEINVQVYFFSVANKYCVYTVNRRVSSEEAAALKKKISALGVETKITTTAQDVTICLI